MKLANTLPISRNFSEQNPVVGLSFSVGYNKLLLFVGETIIVTINNFVRGDVDSLTYLCSPPHILQAYGGLRRGEGTIRSAYTPKERSLLNHTLPSEAFFEKMLEERRRAKRNNFQYDPKKMDFLHRSIQAPAYTTNHLLDATWFQHVKLTHANGEQVNPIVRKLLTNGRPGVPDSNVSFHSSFSGRGLPEPVLYSKAGHLNRQSCEEAMAFLNKVYFFTAEGMVPKLNDTHLN